MYPDVSYVYPKCILDSFGIRVKYMQNVSRSLVKIYKVQLEFAGPKIDH